MENYFKLSFPFVVYTQHCKVIGAIYIREGGGGGGGGGGHFTCPLTLPTNILERGGGGGWIKTGTCDYYKY